MRKKIDSHFKVILHNNTAAIKNLTGKIMSHLEQRGEQFEYKILRGKMYKAGTADES